MEFKAKFFSELTTAELYEILRSRSQIFIVEQNIRCNDMDGTDYGSLHCFLQENDGAVAAYLRAFRTSKNPQTVKIGRVLTVRHGKGYGRQLMEQSLCAVTARMNPRTLTLDAQKHAAGFYAQFGFAPVSGEFLEEGIIHITMERVLSDKAG